MVDKYNATSLVAQADHLRWRSDGLERSAGPKCGNDKPSS